jgi:predicted metal-binding protein
MTTNYEALTDKAVELGASQAKLLDTDAIQFDRRALLKCRFGCNRWGRYWTCQPHVGMTMEDFQESLKKYSRALVIQSSDPRVGQDVTVEIEKIAMLEHGALYTFGMCLCVLCEECAYPDPCKYPHKARPSMDGLGIDITKTVEPLGFQVEFDAEGKFLPAWYTMVLLD